MISLDKDLRINRYWRLKSDFCVRFDISLGARSRTSRAQLSKNISEMLRIQRFAAIRHFSFLPKDHPSSNLPPFVIGFQNGFLPRQEPLIKLPSDFDALENLLDAMPVMLKNGKPGLLQKGKFGPAVDEGLPLYNVDQIEDKRLLTG